VIEMRCLLPFGPNKRHGTRLGVLSVARSSLMYVMSPGLPTWMLDIDVSMDGGERRRLETGMQASVGARRLRGAGARR
jgi:hypothetical protein